MRNLLITGGAGFIGSNFVHYILEKYSDYRIIVFDKLTYAGRLENLARAEHYRPRYAFVQGDICDMTAVRNVIHQHQIDTIVNFAAETHVDRSIMVPDAVITTNINGTWVLLEAARELQLERFHQISTDEVYGAIPMPQRSKEGDPLEPRSPYSASKAGAEHLVYSYYVTYGLPVTTTRLNNIGPFHYPEKALPLFTTNAIDNLPLPIYGDGLQVRDYQYVIDHCEGIDLVLHKGQYGEFYNVGTEVETPNIEMARKILDLLGKPHSLITHVTDRAGHDRRYALDCTKLRALGWHSRHSFDEALEQTVRWYLDNEAWWRPIKSGEYLDYYRMQYEERQG